VLLRGRPVIAEGALVDQHGHGGYLAVQR
jgi:hypothetical protein